jgi:hypothetical protein
MKRKMFAFTVATMLAAAAAHAQKVTRTIESNEQKNNVDTLAALAGAGCAFNFATGSGPTRLAWCVSSNANLVKFESPASVLHLREGLREGYALCTTEDLIGDRVRGFDNGAGSSGFDAPVLLASSTSSVTIRRLTTDGAFQLDHTFARDSKENDVTITVTIKNISGAVADGVVYARFADLDISGDGGDDVMDRSLRGVWARDISVVSGEAVALTATTFSVPAVPVALRLADTTMSGCFASGAPTPLSPGDNAAHVTYHLGGFGVNQTKKVTFTYRRQ